VTFDGRVVTYGFGELDVLIPAYAATIHKSQGSEYPAVIILVMTQHYPMLQRNLLYTGVTRGKRLVVLVGQKKAVAIAVRNVSGRRRWSKLDEWLQRRVARASAILPAVGERDKAGIPGQPACRRLARRRRTRLDRVDLQELQCAPARAVGYEHGYAPCQ
jgi:hypothetical protein